MGSSIVRFWSPLAHRFKLWGYEGGKRDLRIDLLRGFAVLAMVVDHIGGSDNALWLYAITGGNRFFVSAAEPFVFISGVVSGMVYMGVAAKRGVAASVSKALHRARVLYVVTVLVTLSLAALGHELHLWWAPDVSDGGTWRFVLSVVTLHRTLYMADIPLMYTFLLLVAAASVALLSRGRAVLVLAVSWLVWGIWQVSPDSVAFPWAIQGNTMFNLAAWQVLFVNGMVIGWHRARIEAWVRRMPRPALAGSLVLATAAAVGLYAIQMADLQAIHQHKLLSGLLFEKEDVAIGRIAVFAVFFVFSFMAATLAWVPVRRAVGWLLVPLGQNALTAYAFHVLVVAFVTRLNVRALEAGPFSQFDEMVLQVSALGTVWLLVILGPQAWAAARVVLALPARSGGAKAAADAS